MINKKIKELEREIEELRNNPIFNSYEDEFKVWNKEGTGYNHWFLMQLKEAKLQLLKELKQEILKEIDDYFDDEELYFRMYEGVMTSCNKIIAEKLKQKLIGGGK